jgi:ElaB/YqjD/DUF883 family membrane-anchored ribosome-binding protein
VTNARTDSPDPRARKAKGDDEAHDRQRRTRQLERERDAHREPCDHRKVELPAAVAQANEYVQDARARPVLMIASVFMFGT